MYLLLASLILRGYALIEGVLDMLEILLTKAFDYIL